MFLLAVSIGVTHGGINGAASAVAVYSILMGPLTIYVALHPAGGGLQETISILLPATIAGLCGIVSHLGVMMLMRHALPHSSVPAICGAIAGLTIYAIVIRFLCEMSGEDSHFNFAAKFDRNLSNATRAGRLIMKQLLLTTAARFVCPLASNRTGQRMLVNAGKFLQFLQGIGSGGSLALSGEASVLLRLAKTINSNGLPGLRL